jgi:hypothetical protein
MICPSKEVPVEQLPKLSDLDQAIREAVEHHLHVAIILEPRKGIMSLPELLSLRVRTWQRMRKEKF